MGLFKIGESVRRVMTTFIGEAKTMEPLKEYPAFIKSLQDELEFYRHAAMDEPEDP